LLNKAAGDLYEQEFCLRCLRQSLYPFLPTGDFLPLDMVIVNGAGRCFRTQVKGTGVRDWDRRKEDSTAFRYKIGLPDRPSYATGFDILAVFLEPEDLFYLIPAAEVDGVNTLSLRPHIEGTSRFGGYKDNWGIFKS
jgi:hypothetical protein